MRRSSWGAHLTDVVKSRLSLSGQRGSAPRDFIEMAVIVMLAFSIGLAIGAALCRCGQ